MEIPKFYKFNTRDSQGLFRHHWSGNEIQLTDSYFSLIKFDQSQDNDFSRECVLANLSFSATYLTAFPVDCSKRQANAVVCAFYVVSCATNRGKLFEQLDLLLDPVFMAEQVPLL